MDEADGIIITTTPTIEGRRIVAYHGLVSGDAIMGANIVKDIFAGVRDVVGGRSATYERELKKAKELALKELTGETLAAGGNAAIGVDLDYETVGQNGSMLMVTASGTAVTVE